MGKDATFPVVKREALDGGHLDDLVFGVGVAHLISDLHIRAFKSYSQLVSGKQFIESLEHHLSAIKCRLNFWRVNI